MPWNKISNEYARALGRDYAATPKAVYAALAYSLAMRLCEDNSDKARQLLADEWAVLHANGIVPQQARAALRAAGVEG